jgi:hypothetical protein
MSLLPKKVVGEKPPPQRGSASRRGGLYLPLGERYFGCRCCHRLTYRSAQPHDKRADWFRKHPEQLAAILADPNAAVSIGRLILAMKAIW